MRPVEEICALKLKTIFVTLFCCAAGFYAAAVQAHGFDHVFSDHRRPRGFEQQPLTSIEEIKRNGRDDQYVVLRGRLTKYYGKDSYEFADLSGDTIEVKLDDDEDWSYLSRDELIDILGKLDYDWFSVTIDVKRAVPVQQ